MARKKAIAKGSEPYVENYPELHAWLVRHGARCVWQIPRRPTFVERWQFPSGASAIILIHDRGSGWEIFTPEPTGSISIGDTIDDAETRLGLSR